MSERSSSSRLSVEDGLPPRSHATLHFTPCPKPDASKRPFSSLAVHLLQITDRPLHKYFSFTYFLSVSLFFSHLAVAESFERVYMLVVVNKLYCSCSISNKCDYVSFVEGLVIVCVFACEFYCVLFRLELESLFIFLNLFIFFL